MNIKLLSIALLITMSPFGQAQNHFGSTELLRDVLNYDVRVEYSAVARLSGLLWNQDALEQQIISELEGKGVKIRRKYAQAVIHVFVGLERVPDTRAMFDYAFNVMTTVRGSDNRNVLWGLSEFGAAGTAGIRLGGIEKNWAISLGNYGKVKLQIDRLARDIASAQTQTQFAALRRGVSLAGGEFVFGNGTEAKLPEVSPGVPASNENPGAFGTQYTYNGVGTVKYFCDKNIRIIRLPIRWERIQKTMGGNLEQTEVDRIKTVVAAVGANGGKVILDLHNYGRYVLSKNVGGMPKARSYIIDELDGGVAPVSRDNFADLWRKLADVFKADDNVYAYGLMNEPHDMGGSKWQEISNVAVKAIREKDRRKWIAVCGDDWSHADYFTKVKPWIDDKKVMYELHTYFDSDNSGRYALSYSKELEDDPGLVNRGVDRLTPFIKWCRENGVRGFVGEFGVPGEDPRWLEVLDRFMLELDNANMEGCYWAAGELWNGNSNLSIQSGDFYAEPAPQLKILLRRVPPVEKK